MQSLYEYVQCVNYTPSVLPDFFWFWSRAALALLQTVLVSLQPVFFGLADSERNLSLSIANNTQPIIAKYCLLYRFMQRVCLHIQCSKCCPPTLEVDSEWPTCRFPSSFTSPLATGDTLADTPTHVYT